LRPIVSVGLAVLALLALVIALRCPTSKTPARDPAPGPAPSEPTCVDSCRAASRCGVFSTTCLADCEASPDAKACLAQALTDCNAAAQCTFGLVCHGDAPRGRGTCAEALGCQMRCDPGGDGLACGCRCAAALSPQKALLLLQVDACAMECKFDSACIVRSCRLAADACAMQ
jgi:hypothetical protein